MSTTPTEALPRPHDAGAGPPRDTGGRTALRVLLVGFSLLLVAWGALTVASLLGRDTEHRSATYGNVRTLDLDLDFESVTVIGEQSATSVAMDRSYTWSMSRPTVSSRVVGDRLLMTSDCSWTVGLGCTGDVRLVVPRGTTVRVHGSDGHLSLRGLTGTVDAETADAGIDVSDVTGALQLHTSDGSITGTGVRSSAVQATTSDGSVQLNFSSAPTDVRALSSDGSVEVLVPRDGNPWRVDATTSDGSRAVDVATDPSADRRIQVHTSDGSVHIGYGG